MTEQPRPLWTPVGWTTLFMAIKFSDVINRYLVARINKLALYLDNRHQRGV